VKFVPEASVIEDKIQTICDFTGEDDRDFIRHVLDEKCYNE